MCNLALVNGGDSGLSDGTKKAKVTVAKTEGTKVIGDRVLHFSHTRLVGEGRKGVWELRVHRGNYVSDV